MPSRRQIIQSGLAASAAAFLPHRLALARPGHGGAALPRPELFIYDERFPDAVAASRTTVPQGVRLVSTRQVFTSLWYEELDLGWRRTPMVVAGLTTDRTLHVFEVLALDRRMRVIDRAAFGRDGLVSWTLGPVSRPRMRPTHAGA